MVTESTANIKHTGVSQYIYIYNTKTTPWTRIIVTESTANTKNTRVSQYIYISIILNQHHGQASC